MHELERPPAPKFLPEQGVLVVTMGVQPVGVCMRDLMSKGSFNDAIRSDLLDGV
jgi:hypothetical protein